MGAGVYALTQQIPKGRVSTYAAIANALGQPKAARAVGAILRVNPTPIVVPCHRVVYSDGRLGGYGGAGGEPRKAQLLKSEGVVVENGRIQQFERCLFTGFS